MKITLLPLGALLAIASLGSCAHKPSAAIQRIDALIAAGDTLPKTRPYINMFVITGADPTPETLDSSLFMTLDRMSSSSVSDSEPCYVMQHDANRYIAAKKEYIYQLFPNADKFVVDGEPATRAEFDRIPSSLLMSVTGEDNGRKLVAETLADPDAENTAYTAQMDAEQKWQPEIKAIPDNTDIVIDNFQTYPADTRIYVDGILRSADMVKTLTPEEISSITLYFVGDRPYLDINARNYTHFLGEDVKRIPVNSLPSLSVTEIAKSAGMPIDRIVLEGDTVYAFPAPSRQILENAAEASTMDAMRQLMEQLDK